MADSSAVVSAISAVPAALSSVFVAYLTWKISAATHDMRDAATAQARAAKATTLIQLGPIIGQRIDRFINDHRAAFEKLEQSITDRPDLAAAIIAAECGEQTTMDDFETFRVHALDVYEIIPNSADGTTVGPMVFNIRLSVKPITPSLQRALHRQDGYDRPDFNIPRWGTTDTFIVDEAFSRAVYGALWPAIHDCNEILGQSYYYDAADLLTEHIARDWRASLAFKLAETGYRSPIQYARYKLEGKTIVTRTSDGLFSPVLITDPNNIPQLDYASVSVVERMPT